MLKYAISLFFIIPYSVLVAQCDRQQDSINLVQLNEQLNGENWTIMWDFNEPMDNWNGVEIATNGCVCELWLVGDDNIVGELPDLDLPFLKFLNIFNTQVFGEIPNFSNTPLLGTVALTNNQFTGQLPDFSNIPMLYTLQIAGNNISGTIPDFGFMPELFELILLDNNLEGQIPNFSNLPDLFWLNLRNNQLDGEIPIFSNLPDMEELVLDQNELEGPIPDFTQSFITLDIGENNLSGCFPSFICDINDFSAIGNSQLPHGGDHLEFCDTQTQIGSPCDDLDDDTVNDVIQIDCICQGELIDEDNDGFPFDIDCDDTDNSVYPGAPELCDGIDNDCNVLIDDAFDCVCPNGLSINTFIGSTDNWSVANNWSLGSVPVICDEVVIPSGKNVVLYNGEAGECYLLNVDLSAVFEVNSGATLKVVAPNID